MSAAPGLSPRRLLGELRRRRVLRRMMGPKLLDAFAAAYPEAFFCEIGANDGEQHDHLAPHVAGGGWRGIMVEPVPFVFERLRHRYGESDRVTLVNAAIAEREGVLPFYHLAEASPAERDALPGWYDGIGSFSRENVAGHARAIPDIEERIVRIEVEATTLGSLLHRHQVEQIDLLLIDAEGYDWAVLRGIDLEATHPRLVIYEHCHLSPADRAAAAERMRAHGYEVKEEHFDSFCLDTGTDDSLSRAWARLRPGLPGVSAGGPAA